MPESTPSGGDAGLPPDATDPLKCCPRWSHNAPSKPPAICPRRQAFQAAPGARAGLLNFDGQFYVGQPGVPARSALVWHFTPVGTHWPKVVKWPNKAGPTLQLTLEELQLWWALRKLMCCFPSYDARSFFLTTPPPVTTAPIRLSALMPGKRLRRITRCLWLSAGPPAGSVSKFFEEMEKGKDWNESMAASCRCGPKVTPDESMMRWLTQHTCPGWMVCPRKPWRLGRERHTVAGSSRVVHQFETVMGKDRPIGLAKRFEKECGSGVVAMLCRLCEPLFGAGRTVQLDSGFCVLLAIAALRSHGLLPQAQIKKRRHSTDANRPACVLEQG